MSLKTILQKTPLNTYYTEWKWREKKVSYGEEYPDKTFYVIRRATCKVGLFSFVTTFLGQIVWAVEQGYIPVIDLLNNRNTYLTEDLVGRENAWEYFFEQPMGYDMASIAHAKNVILSNGLVPHYPEYPDPQIAGDPQLCERWRLEAQKYIHPTVHLTEEVERVERELFGTEPSRVLGILCRGTDYLQGRPSGHPVQPEPCDVIDKAREMMVRLDCRHIYLATEDEEIYRLFRDAFGDAVKTAQKKRIKTTGDENVNDAFSAGKITPKEIGTEYLISVLILARCTALLAGNAGGTHGALLLTEGYEETYVYDLGLYD